MEPKSPLIHGAPILIGGQGLWKNLNHIETKGGSIVS